MVHKTVTVATAKAHASAGARTTGSMDVKVTDDMNGVNVVKANKRAKEILAQYLISQEPMRVHCDKILCSDANRGGTPPNIAYCHKALASNVKTEGYSPQRPKPGLLRRMTDRTRVDVIVKHNENFSINNESYPPVLGTQAAFECVGGNHLTMTIKLFVHRKKSMVSGETFESEGDDDLQLVMGEGHLYFILREETPVADLRFLSDWANADQNQNQGNSEMQLLVTVNSYVKEDLKVSAHVKVSSIISKVATNSLVKLRADIIGDATKFVSNLGPNSNYLSEIVAHHAASVNPTDLQCSMHWYAEVDKQIPKACPITKVNLAIIQYSRVSVIEQMRPLPDQCRSVSIPDVVSLAKDQDGKLSFIEEFMKGNRLMFEKPLQEHLGYASMRVWLRNLEENIVRCATAKPLDEKSAATFTKAKALGKFSHVKCHALRSDWLRVVQGLSKGLENMAIASGIHLEEEPSAAANLEEVHGS
jgi:hypothetical protein